MKYICYYLARLWVKINLHFYFGKIEVSGLEHIPKDKPVLFLPNHQNALVDVLLIGTNCIRDSWFLTRSDVFKSKILAAIFDTFQMIPIYRIRDGRESLKNNQVIFDRCAELLIQNQAVMMFPEANHNLERRVRPLSKGFTRILFKALNKAPETDIMIIPVGVNYRKAIRFPDKSALCFGAPIAVKELYNPSDEKGSINAIKKEVSSALKTLTTHIENKETYQETEKQLDALGVDYLNPKEVNQTLLKMPERAIATKKSNGVLGRIGKGLFTILNFPTLFIWRIFIKPKIGEDEFVGTFRYAFAALIYPIYYGLIFAVFTSFWGSIIGLAVVLDLIFFNWVYVRMN